jgi:hypothetical protein
MTEALTGTPWLAVLDKVKRSTNDDTTRVLAAMLWDVLANSHDRKVDEIVDAYALKLLGTLT